MRMQPAQQLCHVGCLSSNPLPLVGVAGTASRISKDINLSNGIHYVVADYFFTDAVPAL